MWYRRGREPLAGSCSGNGGVCYGALLSRHPTLPATEAAGLCFVLSDNSKKQVKKTSNEQNSSVRNFMLINKANDLFQYSAHTMIYHFY